MSGLINWKKVAIPSANPDADHVYVGIDIADGVLYVKNSSGTVTKYQTPADVTAAINSAIANLVDTAPTTLDTLNELAAALGDDPNFAATVTTALAGKQPLDSDLTAIAGLTTNGLVTRTGAGTATTRSVAAGTGISVSNGDGVSGDPTITNSDRGSTAVTTHEAASNPHSQYALSTSVTSSLALKADKTTTVSAGTGLSGGGDLSANRTISMPSVGTAGTYGSSTQVPVFTTDAQGRISSVTNTAINFGSVVLTTVLTGLTSVASAAILATDTVLQAFQKLQAQINQAITDSSAALALKANLAGGNSLTGLQSVDSGGVVVGGTTKSAGAIVDLQSTTQGFLPPRMTGAQRASVTNTSDGLLVYDTTVNSAFIFHAGSINDWHRVSRTRRATFALSASGSNSLFIGNFEFRYSLTTINGFIQIRTITGSTRTINWYGATWTVAFSASGGSRSDITGTFTTLNAGFIGNNGKVTFEIYDVTSSELYIIHALLDNSATITIVGELF